MTSASRVVAPTIVMRGRRPWMALGVDHITGHREVVLKNTGSILRSVGPFGGSSVLGDGRPILILDVADLYRRFQEPERNSQL